MKIIRNFGFAIASALISTAVTGWIVVRRPAVGSSPCFFENSDGEVTNLEHLCGRDETMQEDDRHEETVSLKVEVSGPYRVGDTMENGVKIVSDVEELYPTGVRKIVNPEEGRVTLIYPNGQEASPGDSVLLFEDRPPFIVPDPDEVF